MLKSVKPVQPVLQQTQSLKPRQPLVLKLLKPVQPVLRQTDKAVTLQGAEAVKPVKPVQRTLANPHGNLKLRVCPGLNYDDQFTHTLGSCKSPGRCHECIFRRMQGAWKFTWASCRISTAGSWGLGCLYCAALLKNDSLPKWVHQCGRWRNWAMFDAKFSNSAQLCKSSFKRHSACALHKIAVKQCSGNLEEAKMSMAKIAAPSRGAFKKMIQHIRRRDSRAFIEGIGSRKKLVRITACLAAAWRKIHMARIMDAKTVAIHQDKGQGRTLIRFTAAGDDLVRYRGVLGLQTMCGGAVEIVESTRDILKMFCTPPFSRNVDEVAGVRKRPTKNKSKQIM